jgi:hypothetical protein
VRSNVLGPSILHVAHASYIYSLSQNKSTSKVVLSQTFLGLTEFIKKSTSVYDTKFLLLDTS